MAKRYIIDEIRADHWMVRMRDRETGEVVEVPLERKHRRLDDLSPAKADERRQVVTVEPRAEKKSDAKRWRRPSVRSPRGRDASSPETPRRGRSSRDLKHMRRATGRQGRRPRLGARPPTPAAAASSPASATAPTRSCTRAPTPTPVLRVGRRPIRAPRLRHRRGPDEPRQRAGAQRAPAAAADHLSLELARLVCGNTQQKASAAERLEPVFREVDLHTPHEAEPAIKDKPEPPARRAKEAANDEAATPPAMAVDPAMDAQLVESLKKALAELEG
jgi:hypothetical protein